MRGMVAGLASPHPLGAALPALYQEDAFAQRLTASLDEVLSPIFASLDGLASYLDPALAPDDFLDWLAGWVGVSLDETWPIERRWSRSSGRCRRPSLRRIWPRSVSNC